jgi:hypothetical protein
MFDRPTSVHCFSSTITAASPTIGFEPVTMTSSRLDVSGSFSSTRIPWSRKSASWSTFAIARSEFCQDVTSLGAGLYRNSSK